MMDLETLIVVSYAIIVGAIGITVAILFDEDKEN